LRRIRAGKFGLSQSITLDGLKALADAMAVLLPMEAALEHLSSITLSAERAEKTRNGLPTRISDDGFVDGQAIQMLDANEELVAIGFYNGSEKTVQPKIVLV
jgi:tRNA U55 pseudouridine synthase TruB